jgi:hypothetical protein
LEPQSADLPATCRWKWAAAATDRIDKAFTGDRTTNIPEADSWARHWPQKLTVQAEVGLNSRQPTAIDELLTQIRGVCQLLADVPAGVLQPYYCTSFVLPLAVPRLLLPALPAAWWQH